MGSFCQEKSEKTPIRRGRFANKIIRMKTLKDANKKIEDEEKEKEEKISELKREIKEISEKINVEKDVKKRNELQTELTNLQINILEKEIEKLNTQYNNVRPQFATAYKKETEKEEYAVINEKDLEDNELKKTRLGKKKESLNIEFLEKQNKIEEKIIEKKKEVAELEKEVKIKQLENTKERRNLLQLSSDSLYDRTTLIVQEYPLATALFGISLFFIFIFLYIKYRARVQNVKIEQEKKKEKKYRNDPVNDDNEKLNKYDGN